MQPSKPRERHEGKLERNKIDWKRSDGKRRIGSGHGATGSTRTLDFGRIGVFAIAEIKTMYRNVYEKCTI